MDGNSVPRIFKFFVIAHKQYMNPWILLLQLFRQRHSIHVGHGYIRKHYIRHSQMLYLFQRQMTVRRLANDLNIQILPYRHFTRNPPVAVVVIYYQQLKHGTSPFQASK